MTEADGTTVSWAYDADYRLTGETLTAPGGTVQAQASYAYDGVGNRISMSSGTQSYSLPVVANGVVYMGCVSTLAAFHLAGTTPYDGWMRRRDITWGMDARAWTHVLGAGSNLWI